MMEDGKRRRYGLSGHAAGDQGRETKSEDDTAGKAGETREKGSSDRPDRRRQEGSRPFQPSVDCGVEETIFSDPEDLRPQQRLRK